MPRTPSPQITAKILIQFPDYDGTTATCPTHGPFTLDRSRPVCPLCHPIRPRAANLTDALRIARMQAAHDNRYTYTDLKRETARIMTAQARCTVCDNHFTVDVENHSKGGAPCRVCFPFKPRGLSVKLRETSDEP